MPRPPQFHEKSESEDSECVGALLADLRLRRRSLLSVVFIGTEEVALIHSAPLVGREAISSRPQNCSLVGAFSSTSETVRLAYIATFRR